MTPAARPVCPDHEIVLLPFRLCLARLHKDNLAKCTHPLLQLAIFPSQQQTMFAFTEVLNDITLIIDRDTVPLFPEGTLEVSPITWRALHVDTGAEGQAVNLVKAISTPLANASIPIMQISTYESDFTLVPECSLREALDCLTSTFRLLDVPEDVRPQNSKCNEPPQEGEWAAVAEPPPGTSVTERRDVDEGYFSRSSSISEPTGKKSSEELLHPGAVADCPGEVPLCCPPTAQTAAIVGSPVLGGHGACPCIDRDLFITSISEQSLPTFATRLIELLFFSDRRDRFLSFTRSTTANVSLILDQQTLDLFEPYSMQTLGGAWRMIRVSSDAGYDQAHPGDAEPGWFLEQCGIVRDSVQRIADLGITDLFYLSTFTSDWVMVSGQDYPKAHSALAGDFPDPTKASPSNSRRLVRRDAVRPVDRVRRPLQSVSRYEPRKAS